MLAVERMEALVTQAIPSGTLGAKLDVDARTPGAWRLCRTPDCTWVVYLAKDVAGMPRFRAGPRGSFGGTRDRSLRPCVLVADYDALAMAATTFVKKRLPVIVEIAGRGTLIQPPRLSAIRSMPRTTSGSRVPRALILQCAECDGLAGPVRRFLRRLSSRYPAGTRRWSDAKEESALGVFFTEFATWSGVWGPKLRPPEVLRRLESAGWGGSRDHYFHSFQNFFLGLWVIGQAPRLFRAWAEPCRLSWDVHPEVIWFLASLWHDAGYAMVALSQIHRDSYGVSGAEDGAPQSSLEGYLLLDIVREAVRHIASLLEHLGSAGSSRPATAWIPPAGAAHRSPTEEALEGALRDSLLRGAHGPGGALRLYTDIAGVIALREDQAERNRVQQAALLAACSIPFHDWKFREALRDRAGACRIPAATLPFAALLAFVDSLQEDRRELVGSWRARTFLRELTLVRDRVVGAIVDIGALDENDVLWKIVEAREVVSTVESAGRSLAVEYPAWMVA